MVVPSLAMRTLKVLGIGTEIGQVELVAKVRDHYELRALVALQSHRTAGKRGEYVVLVQGADLQRVRLPRRLAHLALDLLSGVHARQAHAVDELVLVGDASANLLLGLDELVPHGRNKQGAVDQRESVVDAHFVVTDETLDLAYAQRAKMGQHKTADLVVAVRTVVLQTDIYRVLLVERQFAYDRPVVALVEHAACGRHQIVDVHRRCVGDGVASVGRELLLPGGRRRLVGRDERAPTANCAIAIRGLALAGVVVGRTLVGLLRARTFNILNVKILIVNIGARGPYLMRFERSWALAVEGCCSCCCCCWWWASCCACWLTIC